MAGVAVSPNAAFRRRRLLAAGEQLVAFALVYAVGTAVRDPVEDGSFAIVERDDHRLIVGDGVRLKARGCQLIA